MSSLDLTEFGKAANWDKLSPEIAGMNFADTVESQKFPGALLPAVALDGRVFWYAVATNSKEWRQLLPLLRAFVGPTVTSFNGQRRPLRSTSPPEAILIRGGLTDAAILMPGSDTVTLCARALARLVRSVESRPLELRPPPLSTASLLARFENALATGDRESAEKWLGVLRGEWRLDEHNLLFAEVRLLWTFRDWKALLSSSWLSALVFIRKPVSIAQMLLEGLWRGYLEPLEPHSEKLKEKYSKDVRGLVLPLLDDLSPVAGEFSKRFRALEAPSISSQPEHPPVGKLSGPNDWREWLSKLTDESYEGYLDDARELAARQDAGSWEDIRLIQAFATALRSVAGPIATERLNASLPTLMQWIKSDAEFPRRIMSPIYEELFTLFALLDSFDKFERESVAELLDSLLATTPHKERYRALIRDVGDLIPDGAGKSSAYWLFDLADIVLRHSAADAGARESFLSKIMGSLQTVLPILDAGQRAAYTTLTAATGWPALPASAVPEPIDFWSRLEGKTVALYTLTDASSRQAKQALETLIPQVRVELSNDHVCTPRLQSLARNADLFVIATSSAKHAATDCIMRNRGNAPLAYAAGRGFSSFLRAIAEYIEK